MPTISSPGTNLAQELVAALAPIDAPTPKVTDDGDPAALPSCFDVTGLAAASIGVAAAELAALSCEEDAAPVSVNRRLASNWFDMTIRPQGWELPPIWDAIAGLYRAKDRWVRLHTNAPHHRAAALKVLSCRAERESVAAQVATWGAEALEDALLGAGGCAAAFRSSQEWATHPQGIAVASEPLIAWATSSSAEPRAFTPQVARPLAGLKVLDCTRVLAGPVCTRFLAGFGAEVLRIDPPGWAEANIEPEITLGKRLSTLNLHDANDRERFQNLLTEADLFVHGYRPGALERLGFGEQRRRDLNPALLDVTLNAYGWTGPWAGRRGYDSLVQMSTGIAHDGMLRGDSQAPQPLPVQALDHATGYLMAAAALRALRIALNTGVVMSARVSLARTAEVLKATLSDDQRPVFEPEVITDLSATGEATPWGPAQRVAFPVIRGCPQPCWSLPARPLHSDPPTWS